MQERATGGAWALVRAAAAVGVLSLLENVSFPTVFIVPYGFD